MSANTQNVRRISRATVAAAVLGTVSLAMTQKSAHGAAVTWDGGGSDGKTSTALNWSTDVAPAATGDTLLFAGTTNLGVTNDSITSLATTGTAITFNSGAGAFNIGGNAITVGSGGGGGQVIVQQNSANPQTISANLTLSGGNGDRSIVFATGAGSLTLSGNITTNNDWLFPNTTAGTLILSGNNTGDGKGTAALTSGTNVMRAMLRNNVAGTTLVLNSDGALANAGSGSAAAGTAQFRGLVANQQLNINLTNGDRDLSGSTFTINASNITVNSSNNLKIGNVINTGGNRDFVVAGSGNVTVTSGMFLSGDQTGRNLFNNVTGTGQLIVNGSVRDTFHSSGLTTAGTSQLRKAGTGTMILNGTNVYTGITSVENGLLRINGLNDQTTLGAITAGRMLVNSSATLGGTGTIKLQDVSGTLTGVSVSGKLAPGASIGTLTVNGTNSARSMIAIETTGVLEWELGAGLSSDLLALTGAATNDLFFNNNVINFIDTTAGGLAAGDYLLISSDAANSYSGLTLSGSQITAGLTIGTGLGAYPNGSVQVDGLFRTGNDIVLRLSPIPEPTTLASVVGLGAIVMLRRARCA